jgi:hypothetical protein
MAKQGLKKALLQLVDRVCMLKPRGQRAGLAITATPIQGRWLRV